MATTYTPNLDLPKHSPSDPFDITLINDMADKLDANAKSQDAELSKRDRVANLLDNSDFRNPIAQAGLNGLHGSTKYVCDRWISWDADATFANGCITPGSPIDQRLDPAMVDLTTTYTAALCLSDGTIKCASGNFTDGFGSYPLGIYCPSATTQPYVCLNTGISIKWAALYEGAYTADTLPAYVPKGYAVELAECQRYFYKSPPSGNINGFGIISSTSTKAIIAVITPTEMRVVPSIKVLKSGEIRSAGMSRNALEITVSTASGNIVTTNVTVASGFSSSNPAVLVNTSFELSADL